MSDSQIGTPELSPEALRRQLSDAARRELETLQAALDARLAALESALAHPEQHASLEELVIALARVATAEAETAATRASLDAQIEADARVTAVSTDARRAAEEARGAVAALRAELDTTRKALDAERQAVAWLQNDARGAGESTAAALSADADAARLAAEERAEAAARERDVAVRDRDAVAAELAAERERTAVLRDQVAEAQRAADTYRNDLTTTRSTVEALAAERIAIEQTWKDTEARLERAVRDRDVTVHERDALLSERNVAVADRDAAARELDAERERASASRDHLEEAQRAAAAHRDDLAALQSRIDALEAERTEIGRARRDAEERAADALRECDALTAAFDDARATADAERTAFEKRLETLDVQRIEAERAREEAEARAGEATARCTALTAELAARPAVPVPDARDEQLAAAAERIRVLELQLFGRDGELREPDVELSTMLEPPPPPAVQPVRRTSRYAFSNPLEIRIDDVVGVLVDLSVIGAQLLLTSPVNEEHEVDVRLPSEETPVSGRARIVWTRLERPVTGKRIRQRVGILFTDVDEAAVEAFIIRHSVGRRPS